jgi:putative ABC transport system permease protein
VLRFIKQQIIHRRWRSMFLAFGILAATVTFSLLTSAATTAELQVRGAITRNWRPSYDILVRPVTSFTQLERAQGLVSSNHLSGVFGGITLRQWHLIRDIPGVEVAAPIENIGYILPFERVRIPLTPYLTDARFQLYRITRSRVANGGLSNYPGKTSYVYVTSDRLVDRAGELEEVVPGHSAKLAVCRAFRVGGQLTAGSPFDLDFQSDLACYSMDRGSRPTRSISAIADVYFPLLIAAVDPEEEEKLVGLSQSRVWGRGLRSGDVPFIVKGVGINGADVREIPVMASSRTFVDEVLVASVERLEVPESVDAPEILASPQASAFLERQQGKQLRVETLNLQSVYDELLAEGSGIAGLSTFESYRQVSRASYGPMSSNRVMALAIRNPNSVWRSSLFDSFLTPPVENNDTQFRTIRVFQAPNSLAGGVESKPRIRIVGLFDPQKLPAFESRNRVPLETYFPPMADAADSTTRGVLGGRSLLPTLNIGGYLAQPPMLLTSIDAARPFFDPSVFSGADPGAPISVVRVRVAGVRGPDPLSRERVRRVAEAIQRESGLAVDITAGSSSTIVQVQLPEGKYGQPPLLLNERWVKKGVSVVILEALDRKSVALFFLVLVVTGLFLVNASLAAVDSRRIEIGTLISLGWTRRAVVMATLGEAGLIGLLAGTIGAGLGAWLGWTLGLAIPAWRTILVIPSAVCLAVVSALPPAVVAAGALPFDTHPVRSSDSRRPWRGRTMLQMAFANVRRGRLRSGLAVAGVFIGVSATALLLAIELAFKGALLGTALGSLISIQVRPVDLASVVLVECLAGLCVADVLFLNLRDRAPELVTLRAAGWRESDLRHLVQIEGAILGLIGSFSGAMVGIGFAALVGGISAKLLAAALGAAAGGTFIAVAASSVPARRIAGLSPPTVLGGE